MATDFFHVKVLSKEGSTVVLRLRIITGEVRDFYRSESFALMLLCGPIANEEPPKSPLGREVTFEDTLDPEWVDDHVDDYIAGVRLYDVKNFPPTVDLAKLSFDERREFFESDDTAPTAKFEIKVTSPKWIEHIRPGTEWDTAAYDVME